jgi:hypothetical protein
MSSPYNYSYLLMELIKLVVSFPSKSPILEYNIFVSKRIVWGIFRIILFFLTNVSMLSGTYISNFN